VAASRRYRRLTSTLDHSGAPYKRAVILGQRDVGAGRPHDSRQAAGATVESANKSRDYFTSPQAGPRYFDVKSKSMCIV
jgi:hypothetical protein